METNVVSLLDSLPAHIHDPTWLQKHKADIYQAIQEGLKSRMAQQQAVMALVLMFPRVLQQDDLREWTNLLKQAQKKLESNVTEATILGPIYVFPPRNHTPLYPNRQRKRSRTSPGQLAEMYLAVLLAPHNHTETVFNHHTIDALMRFTKVFNVTYYIFKFYQLAAFILNHLEDYQRALSMADLIGDYFAQKGEMVDDGLKAYARGQAEAGLGNVDHARRDLQHAVDTFMQAGYDRQSWLARQALQALA